MNTIGSLQGDVQDIENAGYLTPNSYNVDKNAFGVMLWDWLHRYETNYVPTDTSNRGWAALGICIIYYTELNKLVNQPSQWGQLINIPVSRGSGNEVMQIWIRQPDGDIYTRGGNGSQVMHSKAFHKFTYT